MSEVSELIHRIRDGLLVAATAIERDDELAAAEVLERTISEARDRIDELRTRWAAES